MSIRTPVIVALLAGFAATAVANAPAPTPHIAPYDATYESKVVSAAAPAPAPPTTAAATNKEVGAAGATGYVAPTYYDTTYDSKGGKGGVVQGQAVGQYASQGPYDTTYDSKVKETVGAASAPGYVPPGYAPSQYDTVYDSKGPPMQGGAVGGGGGYAPPQYDTVYGWPEVRTMGGHDDEYYGDKHGKGKKGDWDYDSYDYHGEKDMKHGRDSKWDGGYGKHANSYGYGWDDKHGDRKEKWGYYDDKDNKKKGSKPRLRKGGKKEDKKWYDDEYASYGGGKKWEGDYDY